MAQPTTRILTVLELLQANHRLSGEDLARRLDVDVRTIRRDVTRLVDLGIPVLAERGRYGGYRLMPGYKLPPLMLTDSEAVAVLLGLQAGKQIGLTTTAPAVESALAKLHRVLPAALAERALGVQESLGFTSTAREPTGVETGVLLTLGEAARRRRRVRLRYRGWKGEETERELDAYGLVFHSGRWYVAGHDHRSGSVRTFRVDRVAAAALGTVEFARPEAFDAVRHVVESLASVPYTWEVEVVFDARLAEVRRRIPASSATLEETPDGVRLVGRAEKLDGMARLLAGMDWPFRVVRPEELRDEVRRHADRLVRMAAL